MFKRWRQLQARERLIFLVIFAVLLPTVVLLVTQYYSLQDLREKTRIAFENNLRQNLQAVDDRLAQRLEGTGDRALAKFDRDVLEFWSGGRVKAKLNQILSENAAVESVFAITSERDGSGYTAIFDRTHGYHETKSSNSPDNPFFSSPDEENITVAFVAAAQSPAGSRGALLFAQSRCERCASPGDKFYLFRPLSDLSDITTLRLIGIALKRDFAAGELLTETITASNGETKNLIDEIVYGVFDENGRLVFSGAGESSADSPDFEARIPLQKTFARWTLAGSFRDERIENLTRNYFYRNLLLLLLLFSLLVVGLALILSVTTKEVELAVAKSAFVSNVSHELKTPLSLIRLFAETLEAGRVKSPEKAQEYYGIIARETNRLTQLINNILDFAAIEAGRKQYNFARADINETVAEVVENYRYVLETNGFEIRACYAPDLPPVSVDRDAIEQAVLNLLNNACKYSDAEKFVEIKTAQRKGQVIVSIADRGIGIAPREQEKIFEQFYRSGGASDVHNVKGSGLGLALVRHIVAAHNGRVTVSSALKKGSTFTIFLPAAKKNDASLRTERGGN